MSTEATYTTASTLRTGDAFITKHGTVAHVTARNFRLRGLVMVETTEGPFMLLPTEGVKVF
jgi:hypothetical protein